MRALKITKNITRRDEKSLEKYFNEISKHEVISPEAEYELFDWLKNGEAEVIQDILHHNLRFVVSVAKQYQNLGLPLGDLISEGNIGLIKAAKRFDPSRGFKFISYAVWWIRQSILQAVNEKSRKIRIPSNVQSNTMKVKNAEIEFLQRKEREPTLEELSDVTGLRVPVIRKGLEFYKKCSSLDAPVSQDGDAAKSGFIEDESIDSPDHNLEHLESLIIEVKRMLRSLPARQSEVLARYYGIGFNRSMTLSDIADDIGLTRERVRQIKDKGIIKLRKRFHESATLLAE